MVFTRTVLSTGSNNQTIISSNSQTQYSDANTENNEQVSEDPHLKLLTNLKMMYESEIELSIEFITSGIDCREDPETVKETLHEFKELLEKCDFTIQGILDAEPLCSNLSKLKIKIRKTTSAYQKYKKELVSEDDF